MISQEITLQPIFEIPPDDLVNLYVENRTFLEPYEPKRPDIYFTRAGQIELLNNARRLWEEDSAYTFAICAHRGDHATPVPIGRMSLSNVVRGSWHSCTVGYFVSQHANNRGIATQAFTQAVRFAFQDAKLHRVQAAIMPRNIASLRVVEKVGFHYEGLAKYYLNINGVWEDPRIYSVTPELWTGR